MYNKCSNGKKQGETARTCGNVINPRTLPESVKVPATHLLTVGPVITKVPVVLAERTVQIDVESDITLDRPAIEIKRIRKEIFLTQCRLLPRVGKLFLRGFVRKNIEFATGDCVDGCAVSGDIRHTTVNVPFEAVTFIPFVLGTRPIEIPNRPALEFQNFDPKVMGADFREQDMESTQFFNERIFCELVRAKFVEADIQTDRCSISPELPVEGTFRTFTEKLVVLLTFKLLQLQQVRVEGIPFKHEKCEHEYEHKHEHDHVEMEIEYELD